MRIHVCSEWRTFRFRSGWDLDMRTLLGSRCFLFQIRPLHTRYILVSVPDSVTCTRPAHAAAGNMVRLQPSTRQGALLTFYQDHGSSHRHVQGRGTISSARQASEAGTLRAPSVTEHAPRPLTASFTSSQPDMDFTPFNSDFDIVESNDAREVSSHC